MGSGVGNLEKKFEIHSAEDAFDEAELGRTDRHDEQLSASLICVFLDPVLHKKVSAGYNQDSNVWEGAATKCFQVG